MKYSKCETLFTVVLIQWLSSIATSTSTNFASNDGEELLTGEQAVLEPVEWQTDTLREGTLIFLDRGYTFADVPEELEGKTFIRSSIEETRVVCREPGVVYIITSSKEWGAPISRASDLENMGFWKARIPEFQLFGRGVNEVCSVYQKRLEEGERIEIPEKWCVVVARAVEDAKIELASNSDGEEFLAGDSAVLEPLEWETDTLRKGTQVFLDINYTFADVPEELEGKTFIRSNFFGTRKVCFKSGVVYAITPSKERGRFSRATELERIGFRKAKIPEFQAFSNGWRAICSVYQKRLKKGERIDIGSPGLGLTPNAPWCVIVAKTPLPSGKVGDQAGYHPDDVESAGQRFRTTFAPPLAQDYTIAAQVPDHTKYFIHDPGMTRLPSGHFLVAAPCWERGVGPDHLIMSRSDDRGKTWKRLSDLPYAEGTPFIVNDTLYMFTQPKQHQDVYFMRSDDEGETWTEPVKVLKGPYWNCKTSMVIKDGQLYWVLDRKHKATVAIAADLSKDLLDPSTWRISEVVPATQTPIEFRTRHDKHEPDKFDDWNLEGNVMNVNGHLRIACRVNPKPTGTTPSLAAVFDLKDDGVNLDLKFDQLYPWPGGQCKFCIVYDEITHLFWMATNIVSGSQQNRLGGGANGERRFLMLYYGLDGLNWLPAGCIAMAPCSTQSFMYPSMVIDGDDLAVLSRSGRNSGHFHDADLATFHRVHNFRALAWH